MLYLFVDAPLLRELDDAEYDRLHGGADADNNNANGDHHGGEREHQETDGVEVREAMVNYIHQRYEFIHGEFRLHRRTQ